MVGFGVVRGSVVGGNRRSLEEMKWKKSLRETKPYVAPRVCVSVLQYCLSLSLSLSFFLSFFLCSSLSVLRSLFPKRCKIGFLLFSFEEAENKSIYGRVLFALLLTCHDFRIVYYSYIEYL